MINYLPPFIGAYKEIQVIMDVEQPICEQTWTDTENVLADQFVVDATENGVARYEKILEITPKATYTLDERKFNILARMNEQLPYTLGQLHVSLTSLCGVDGYSLKLDADNYKLVVRLSLVNENKYDAVVELLHKMLPANIVKDVTLFNTYLLLSDFTHEQLSTYTHDELRKAIL